MTRRLLEEHLPRLHSRPAPRFALWLLVLVVSASACSATACGQPAPPVAPTRVTVQTQPLPSSGYPTVTITATGGNGLAACAGGPKLGSTVSYPLGINESGASIQLILDPHNYPVDHWADYEGTLSGTTIHASGTYYGDDLCGGGVVVGQTNHGVPSTFTGSISADGTTLTGHEVRTAPYAGQTFTYEYDWQAVLK